MGEKSRRLNRFLSEHPFCCLCGGVRPAVEQDHIPPRACFPKGLMPEGFEFPSCVQCNRGSRDADQVFGFYARLFEFDERNMEPGALSSLSRNLHRFQPDYMPKQLRSIREKRNALAALQRKLPFGQSVADVPIVAVPVEFDQVAITMGRKLACALGYRHLGRPLTSTHRIATGWFQEQTPDTSAFTDEIVQLTSRVVMTSRSNIKDYGERFRYRYDCNPEDQTLVYLAQWGRGLIVWGMTAPLDYWIVWDEEDPEGATWEDDTHPIFGPASDL